MSRLDARAARLAVGFAAVFGVLLAVVALASGGPAPADGRAGPLAPGAASWLYALFVVLGLLAVPLVAYVYAREVPQTRQRRRRASVLPFVLIAVATVLLIVALRSPEGFADAVGKLRIVRAPEDELEAAARRPPALELFPFMVVSSAVLAGAAALAAHRLLRRPRRGTLPEELSQALDESLDDLRAEPDARLAVVRAYARMEATLERAGVPRREADAPLEYVGRALLELDVSREPVEALADLYERARFSRHEIGAELKAEAIEALQAIRDELCAS